MVKLSYYEIKAYLQKTAPKYAKMIVADASLINTIAYQGLGKSELATLYSETYDVLQAACSIIEDQNMRIKELESKIDVLGDNAFQNVAQTLYCDNVKSHEFTYAESFERATNAARQYVSLLKHSD